LNTLQKATLLQKINTPSLTYEAKQFNQTKFAIFNASPPFFFFLSFALFFFIENPTQNQLKPGPKTIILKLKPTQRVRQTQTSAKTNRCPLFFSS